MQSYRGAEVYREMLSERYLIAGQPRWDSEGIGAVVSSWDGPLGDVGAVWVFCDPSEEEDVWASALPVLRRAAIFTWSAKLRPEAWEPPVERDERSLLWRSGQRAATEQFADLPRFESRYQVSPNTEPTVRDVIGDLGTRSSGFACAVGDRAEPGDSWIQSAQIMETHFSLSRDFKNSMDLESRRRRIASLYVRFSVEAGFFPVIPLTKHPHAGLVLFCPAESYPDIFRRMSSGVTALEGSDAKQRINDFLGQGGDLAYL
ncbi:hypothetical protein PUR59_23190 [Streptomyces sp. SP18ES09]|uniref:hypothetical protein n=1 Tax=Streptomyces sp. SP18ES09 TaxID=3002532 RepID=UPI002E766865|nr:hypothetical protein [Streptomyces sp. SP18ES09]MEE1817913.1 hypothetical protein [Streptomyces sp. SP18ES09]